VLNCLIRPLRSRVQHLEVDEPGRLRDRDRFHASLIRYIWRKHDAGKLHNGRVNFEKDRVSDTSILAREIFHWVIAAKAQVDIPTHALKFVGVPTPLIDAGCRNVDTILHQIAQGVQELRSFVRAV